MTGARQFVVFVKIDPCHDRDVFSFAWSRNNDLAGTRLEVAFGLGSVGKQSGAFENNFNAEIFPGNRGGTLPYREALNAVSVDNENVIFFCTRRGLFALSSSTDRD